MFFKTMKEAIKQSKIEKVRYKNKKIEVIKSIKYKPFFSKNVCDEIKEIKGYSVIIKNPGGVIFI